MTDGSTPYGRQSSRLSMPNDGERAARVVVAEVDAAVVEQLVDRLDRPAAGSARARSRRGARKTSGGRARRSPEVGHHRRLVGPGLHLDGHPTVERCEEGGHLTVGVDLVLRPDHAEGERLLGQVGRRGRVGWWAGWTASRPRTTRSRRPRAVRHRARSAVTARPDTPRLLRPTRLCTAETLAVSTRVTCAGPGAPHGAWPLVAAECGTRGCRGPAHSTIVTGERRQAFRTARPV